MVSDQTAPNGRATQTCDNPDCDSDATHTDVTVHYPSGDVEGGEFCDKHYSGEVMSDGIPGIVEMPENARFVGNGMTRDEWTMAAVWSPEPITVGEDVEVVYQYEADGTAPAVTGGGLEDKNEKVAGWTKYELKRGE